MSKLKIALVYILLFLLLINAPGSESVKSGRKRNQLLYIYIEGFRHDYVDNQPPEDLPGFHQFLNEGSKASMVYPIFPALSDPCVATLTTGLYPESHSVVGNYMYDSVDKDFFGFEDPPHEKIKWWPTEPIWTTATKNGLNTAVINFGRTCHLPFSGVLPQYCLPLQDLDNSELLKGFQNFTHLAMEKLKNGTDFVMLYTGYADLRGHHYGPESHELRQAVKDIDKDIQYILKKEKEDNLTGKLNIVIVSDHGMRASSLGKIKHVEMDDYVLVDDVELMIDYSAYSNIKVLPGRIEKVYSKLKTMPGVDVYKHEDIPEELHIKNNRLTYDILLKAHPDTYILPSYSEKMIPPRGVFLVPNGDHGWWAKEDKNMSSIFFVRGPDFTANRKIIPPIEQVDIYPLLTHILKFKALPNNGSLQVIKQVLKDADSISEGTIMGKTDSIFLAFLVITVLFY